jgi:hypothetical protein
MRLSDGSGHIASSATKMSSLSDPRVVDTFSLAPLPAVSSERRRR